MCIIRGCFRYENHVTQNFCVVLMDQNQWACFWRRSHPYRVKPFFMHCLHGWLTLQDLELQIWTRYILHLNLLNNSFCRPSNSALVKSITPYWEKPFLLRCAIVTPWRSMQKGHCTVDRVVAFRWLITQKYPLTGASGVASERSADPTNRRDSKSHPKQTRVWQGVSMISYAYDQNISRCTLVNRFYKPPKHNSR